MNNKKRMVHIISSLKRGGAESLLVDLLAHLKEYEHFVLYFHDGPNRQRLEQCGIKTYEIKGIFFQYDLLFFVRLIYQVQKLKPHIIHTALWMGNCMGRIVARLLNIPFVSVVHLGVDQDGYMRNVIDRFTFWLSRDVVAVSTQVAQTIKAQSWIPSSRLYTITNGIDIRSLHRQASLNAQTRDMLSIAHDSFVIGSVGRFIARKNYSFLLTVFARLKASYVNTSLVLIGFGPEEQSLRRQAQALMIAHDVHFIINESACRYYQLFDCFVLPSLQEGLSIALLEAMAFSLPPIIYQASGQHDVITHNKNGIIMRSFTQSAWVSIFMHLINNLSLCKKLGLQAYKTSIDSFSMQAMKQSYKQLFEKNAKK